MPSDEFLIPGREIEKGMRRPAGSIAINPPIYPTPACEGDICSCRTVSWFPERASPLLQSRNM